MNVSMGMDSEELEKSLENVGNVKRDWMRKNFSRIGIFCGHGTPGYLYEEKKLIRSCVALQKDRSQILDKKGYRTQIRSLTSLYR